uniref:Uncharacterized protein n=1 Tax=Mycena chlorophos TaxID=658473 RepID=A0ABQ0LY36_MYCCL|nr:predicted protein [Mycena chlorophos]
MPGQANVSPSDTTLADGPDDRYNEFSTSPRPHEPIRGVSSPSPSARAAFPTRRKVSPVDGVFVDGSAELPAASNQPDLPPRTFSPLPHWPMPLHLSAVALPASAGDDNALCLVLSVDLPTRRWTVIVPAQHTDLLPQSFRHVLVE